MIEKATDKLKYVVLTKPFLHGDVHWYPKCSRPNHTVMSVGNMCRVWAEQNKDMTLPSKYLKDICYLYTWCTQENVHLM